MKSIVLFLYLSIITVNISASEEENVLKGVMLERISQFITYKKKNNFTICTYRDKQIFTSFSQLFQHRIYQSNAINIQNLKNLSKVSQCDIFYVENPSKSVINKILKGKNDYTLLVTDNVALLDDGFMLALFLHNNKIKFAINQQALLDAQLKVNYRLLRVASKVVNPVKIKR